MDNSLLADIEKRTGCLIGIMVFALVVGIVVGILTLAVAQANQQITDTPTPLPCQIGLDTRHDLYDTVEAYHSNHYPIGELEIGVYTVVAQTDALLAIDWRGSMSYPPPQHLLDWIAPVNGIDEMYGDCRHVIKYIPSTPTPDYRAY